MTGLVIEAASKEDMSGYKSDDMTRSALSRENSQCLKIEDDYPLPPEKKSKLGTEVAEGGDVEEGGGQSFEIVPVIPWNDSDEDEWIEKHKDHIMSDYDSDEDYGLDGSSEFNVDLWNKYYDQINKSQGFDIDLDVYPGCCVMAPFQPLPYFKKYPELVKRLEALVNSALQWFNTEHSTKFEFVEIEKVVQRDWHYYLTFKAKDPEAADAAPKSFQARVYDGLKGPDVELCRIKVVG